MSKARELLNRCAVNLRVRDICPLLLKEVSELLNEPEQMEHETLREHVDRNKEWYNIGYRAAKEELKREPLSYEEIENGRYNHLEYEYNCGFENGVRFAEQEHGITEIANEH
jgi:hypothetical protein